CKDDERQDESRRESRQVSGAPHAGGPDVTKDEVLEQVRRAIADQFGIAPGAVTRETVALDVDGWDSVTHVYLMLEIERRFGKKIPEDRVFAMDNVGDLVDLLAGLAG